MNSLNNLKDGVSKLNSKIIMYKNNNNLIWQNKQNPGEIMDKKQ